MSEILQLAAKLNMVSGPVEGFEKSLVLFQIVSYNKENSKLITALVIRPDKKSSDSSSILIVGYSPKNKKVTTLNSEQVLFVLEQLQKYSEEELVNCKLNLMEIKDAESNFSAFDACDNESIICLKLTQNINAFYSKKPKDECLWQFELEFNDELSIMPISFNFIGAQGSNDIINFTFNSEQIGFDKLKTIHLLDDIKIMIDTGKGKHHEYTGICTKVSLKNNNITMFLNAAGMYFMKKSRLKAFLAENVNPLNVFYFIARSSGLAKEKVNIEGFNWGAKNIYTVILPVNNLVLQSDSTGIGNVTFYSHITRDIDTQKFVKVLEKENEKLDEFCWAQIHVEGNNPYDAYVDAKLQISRSLDTMMHIVRSDSLFLNYSTECTLISWEKENLIPKPYVTTWIYIHNAISGELIITDTKHLMQPNHLLIKQNLVQRIDNIEWYEEMLLELSHKSNKKLEPLFNALKWVKKSWDSIDKDDEIIYMIIALEFVLAGEKAPPIIPEEYHQTVTKAVIESFAIAFSGEEMNKQEYMKRLSDKMSQSLTDAPLFAKLDILVSRLNIPLRKQDIKLLKKARQFRNDLVHGRKSNMLTYEEVWKVNTIVNTIISYKLFSLRGEF